MLREDIQDIAAINFCCMSKWTMLRSEAILMTIPPTENILLIWNFSSLGPKITMLNKKFFKIILWRLKGCKPIILHVSRYTTLDILKFRYVYFFKQSDALCNINLFRHNWIFDYNFQFSVFLFPQMCPYFDYFMKII